MDSGIISTILMGSAASISMNVGKGIQKMKVKVLKKWPKVLAPENRRDFLIWCVGMSMTAVAGILFTVALGKANPSIVSSLNGVGLIALAFFTSLVLKEKVGAREWSAIGMIIAGTFIVQSMNKGGGQQHQFTLASLLWMLGVCIGVFVVLVFLTKALNKGRAFVYAAIAGTFLAIMVIFFKVANVEAGAGALGKFLNIYFLIGFMNGNGAFVFTNLAFFHGTATMIVPTVNSFLIIMPMIMEIFIFRVTLQPVQYLGAAVIVLGVILLTTGMKQDMDESH